MKIDMKLIIEDGIKLKLEHKSKWYGVSIPYRPLSDYENIMSSSNAILEVAKSQNLSTGRIYEMIENRKDKDKDIEESTILQLYFTELKMQVIYMSMRDFCTPDFSIDIVKKMKGTNEIFKEILDASDKSFDELKLFREK